MKGSIIVVLFFAVGILIGRSGIIPWEIDFMGFAQWALYILIAIIGFEFGHKNLVKTMKGFRMEYFLMPVFTIIGTLSFSAIAWLILKGYPVTDYLAIGSGFGYYSLAPMLIMDAKTSSVGINAAAEIGTIALMSNMVREILALTCAAVFRRFFGWYAPIAAAGVASIDVVLPTIIRNCGHDALPVAIMQGVILELGVPLLVTLFMSF